MNPIRKALGAMPGTLADLVERTGYPAGQVLKFIGTARKEGVNVRAVMMSRIGEDHEPTVYTTEDKA